MSKFKGQKNEKSVNNGLESYIREKGRPVYMPYLTIGDPNAANTVAFAVKMIDAGADLLELGIPFSDPTADGPVIQAAMVRSMKNGYTAEATFGVIQSIHKQRPQTPLVILTYLNPILFAFEAASTKARLERFFREVAQIGVKGIVIPDLPIDQPEFRTVKNCALDHGINVILMIAPSTNEKRMKEICEQAGGFIYFVTSMGVTGERKSFASNFARRVKLVKDLSGLPVLAGFGFSKPEQAKESKSIVDGVIVGSLNHRIIEENSGDTGERLASITKEFSLALR